MEHNARKPDFTEHSSLERGCDGVVKLAMSTRKGDQQDSTRFDAILVGGDDLTDVLSHRLVILRMNGTGYWEG